MDKIHSNTWIEALINKQQFSSILFFYLAFFPQFHSMVIGERGEGWNRRDSSSSSSSTRRMRCVDKVRQCRPGRVNRKFKDNISHSVEKPENSYPFSPSPHPTSLLTSLLIHQINFGLWNGNFSLHLRPLSRGTNLNLNLNQNLNRFDRFDERWI